jgi:hypothetical protein
VSVPADSLLAVEYFKAYYKKRRRQIVGNLSTSTFLKSCSDNKFLLSALLKQLTKTGISPIKNAL